MKQECGKTAWNDAGIKYYNDALKKWKKVYSTREYFNMLEDGWEEWLLDVGSNLNSAGWTRKDLSRLLATREEGEMAMEGGDADGSDSDKVMIGPGGARRGGERTSRR